MLVDSQNIELKEFWDDECLKSICSFANAQGGKLYIGCNGNDSKRLLEELPNKIIQALGVIAEVNLLKEGSKEYIEITVNPYTIGITYKGVYHYRNGSTKQVLTGPSLEAFFNKKRGATWDNMPIPAFTLNDVEDSLIEKFKNLARKKGRIDPALLDENKDVLLEKLHLINGNYLTNAAMMLFSKDPERYQLGAFVKLGFFLTDSELLYQDEVRGSLLELPDKIIELVYLKYMKAKITYEGLLRRERYFVPEAALRESILNALCHTQYNYGIPIQISIYEDRLYVANCGSLPDGWSVENLLLKHSSKPYNPNIAQVFYLAGFIESWGRGIEKICSSCVDDNLPPPEFFVNPQDIMVKFTAPRDRIVSIYSKVTEGVTEKENEVLHLLSRNPTYTYELLARELSTSRKTISKRVKSLKDKGVIKRVGSDTKGYWQIV